MGLEPTASGPAAVGERGDSQRETYGCREPDKRKTKLKVTTKRGSLYRLPLNLLAEPMGLEPTASGVTGRRYNQLNYGSAQNPLYGGRNRARTCDPRLVRPMLSQLSYPPAFPHNGSH